ncbi:MAG: DUF6783 domain-containing protein [Ruminococcus sp.]
MKYPTNCDAHFAESLFLNML